MAVNKIKKVRFYALSIKPNINQIIVKFYVNKNTK